MQGNLPSGQNFEHRTCCFSQETWIEVWIYTVSCAITNPMAGCLGNGALEERYANGPLRTGSESKDTGVLCESSLRVTMADEDFDHQ